MGGSRVSSEAPARRDNRAVLAVDGPQSTLDRAAGTNQEIERRSRRTEASRLSPAWRTDSLPQSPHYRPRWVWLVAARVSQWWMPEPALFSNFLPTLTVLRRGLPTVLPNATSPEQDRQKTPAWRGSWQVARPAPFRAAARAVGTR